LRCQCACQCPVSLCLALVVFSLLLLFFSIVHHTFPFVFNLCRSLSCAGSVSRHALSCLMFHAFCFVCRCSAPLRRRQLNELHLAREPVRVERARLETESDLSTSHIVENANESKSRERADASQIETKQRSNQTVSCVGWLLLAMAGHICATMVEFQVHH